MTNSAGVTTLTQGRIVWTGGNLFTGKIKTEYNSQQPKLNALGEQIKEYSFGLAIPKTALQAEAADLWAALHSEAQALYPSGNVPPDFSMKFKDGDGVDHKGVPFSQREGYAGHIVLACSTTLPVKYFKWENNQNVMINEGIKCGDYVNVQLTIKGHVAKGQGKAGIYVNPMAVQLIGYGKEIINTPSGDQIFGLDMPPAPAGSTATPMASAPMPAMQGQPAPVQAAPAPNYGVLPQNQQPAAPAMAAPAPLVSPTQGVVPQPTSAGMPPIPGQ